MTSRFEIALAKRITEEMDRLKNNLAKGDAIKDYAQYQNYVGRLTALGLVLSEYYEDVQTELNKE
jgi:hypothetical protein